MDLTPATEPERRRLAFQREDKKLEVLTERFDSLVLLFTDGTAEEIEAHGTPAPSPPGARRFRLREVLQEAAQGPDDQPPAAAAPGPPREEGARRRLLPRLPRRQGPAAGLRHRRSRRARQPVRGRRRRRERGPLRRGREEGRALVPGAHEEGDRRPPTVARSPARRRRALRRRDDDPQERADPRIDDDRLPAARRRPAGPPRGPDAEAAGEGGRVFAGGRPVDAGRLRPGGRGGGRGPGRHFPGAAAGREEAPPAPDLRGRGRAARRRGRQFPDRRPGQLVSEPGDLHGPGDVRPDLPHPQGPSDRLRRTADLRQGRGR